MSVSSQAAPLAATDKAKQLHGLPRDAVSDETVEQRLRRYVLGLAWAVRPKRIGGLAPTLAMLAAHYASADRSLPNPDDALDVPDGLAGICDALDPETLLLGYARGLYPWCHLGPMKWWAPRERMVLFFDRFHMEKNLRRRLRNNHFSVTFDTDFLAVMQGCAEPRPGRPSLTWITPQIMRAFLKLHELGHAHSVEVWNGEGELVGGLYGLAVGGVFFTESQFTRKRDASKVGFATLNCHLQHWGFALNDGKHATAHLVQLGFEQIPRSRFNGILREHCGRDRHIQGPWQVDTGLDVGAWDPAAAKDANG